MAGDPKTVTRPLTVAYLMTHYPYPSQTFLTQEVISVEREGVRVVPIAINAPAEGDLLTEFDHRERARTTYVKTTSPGALARIMIRTAGRHPIRFSRVMGRALAFGSTTPRRAIWRFFQVVEAAVVWDRCRRAGVDHLHAQFGGVPAWIALFARDIARTVDGTELSWSCTIHGIHDFFDFEGTRLDVKAHDAAAIVCIADQLRAQVLMVAEPRDWPKVHVVRCGIDLGAFPARDRQPDTSRARILIVGRLSAEKGHLVVLEALHLLASRGVDAELRIVGSGPLGDDIRAEADRLGLGDRVVMLGMQPSAVVASELRDANVFCLASFGEGVPVSIMEALAVGVPVVCTAVGGIPELVTDGVTGWCVSPGRADLLADALERALRDADHRAAIVAAGRERVAAMHDTRRSGVEMANLLRSLAE